MPNKLPVNLEQLVRQRRVEGDRIEFKAGWNPDATIKTLCAFANDFENLGGGYVVIGQDCNRDGTAIFPPVGLNDNQLDPIQRELLQYCQLIQDIVSYPGPDPSIRIESLNRGKIMARRYRNRRIGEFFKELELTEGRCTGIPKMRAAMERNGSPEPRFSTDEARTHFVVELPVHPELEGLRVHDEAHDGAHDEAHDEAHDDLSQSELRVLEFVAENAKPKAEIAQELGLSARGRAIHRLLEELLSKTLLEMTLPDKPNSRNQRYKITQLGNSKRQKR